MSLKERLEHYIALAGQHARPAALCCTLDVGDARKVLALIAAAEKLNATVKSRFVGLEIVALVPQDLRHDVADTDATLTAMEA